MDATKLLESLIGKTKEEAQKPKIIAIFTNRTVLASKGYIEGTYAENNSRCYSAYLNFPVYAGSVNNTQRSCYKTFNP